jgi:hypothetical protein
MVAGRLLKFPATLFLCLFIPLCIAAPVVLDTNAPRLADGDLDPLNRQLSPTAVESTLLSELRVRFCCLLQSSPSTIAQLQRRLTPRELGSERYRKQPSPDFADQA